MEARSTHSTIEEWSRPGRRPHGTTVKSAARWEETEALPPAARCAIAPGAAASSAARSRQRTDSRAAARTGKIPGKRPTPQPPRRNGEELVWRRAVRSEKEETR